LPGLATPSGRAPRAAAICTADGARIFDQLAVLFDRGLFNPLATNTWPLQNSVEAYQRVQDGAHGIKQVLLPAGGQA
jgi:hypothetical protein